MQGDAHLFGCVAPVRAYITCAGDHLGMTGHCGGVGFVWFFCLFLFVLLLLCYDKAILMQIPDRSVEHSNQ